VPSDAARVRQKTPKDVLVISAASPQLFAKVVEFDRRSMKFLIDVQLEQPLKLRFSWEEQASCWLC
jgi:hypothetical protein